MLYPAYAWAEEHGLPIIVHSGTSTFSGSTNSYADPALLDEVFRDFPDLHVVLAHGGRGWLVRARRLPGPRRGRPSGSRSPACRRSACPTITAPRCAVSADR